MAGFCNMALFVYSLVHLSCGCPVFVPMHSPPPTVVSTTTQRPTTPTSPATDPTVSSSPATDPTVPSSPATDPAMPSSPATDPAVPSSTVTVPPTPATDQTSPASNETVPPLPDADETTSSSPTTNETGTPTPRPHCCNGKTGRTTAPPQWPDNQSPAGGPAGNPQAAVCIFYRISNCLICRKGLLISKCCTAVPCVKDDTAQGGPTPYNEYLIGQRYTHVTHMIDWYNLYPRKEAPLNGYYGYNNPTATGRKTLGLHPGTLMLGCVTAINDAGCWAATKNVLDKGSLRYNNSGYRGFLYVIPA